MVRTLEDLLSGSVPLQDLDLEAPIAVLEADDVPYPEAPLHGELTPAL